MRLSAKLFLWLGVFAVLGVLGLWMEHERAAARTRAFKERLEAKGERLSYTNHVPPMPPAASNGALDFIRAAGALTSLNPDFQPQRMRLVAPARARVSWRLPMLPTAGEPDVWPAMAAHVDENRVALAEMHAALERPVMVHKLEYEKTFAMLMPQLMKLKSAANSLSFATIYNLHEGNRSLAFTNLLAGIRSGGRLKEPVVISQLFRAACGSIMLGTTWEALQHPGWKDAELAALQQAWEEFDTLEGYMGSLRMERAMGVAIAAQCRTNFQMLVQLGDPGGYPRTGGFFETLFNDPGRAGEAAKEVWFRLTWPAWGSYADERWLLERHQIWLDGARFALATNSYAPVKAQVAASAAAHGEPGSQHILSRMIVPTLDNYLKKVAMHEASRRIAATAIALERHKLRNGKYPENLAALVPEFMAAMPRDFMDGQPLRYRLLPDGQFLLWSIGDDFVDDGGDGTTPPTSTPGSRIWTQGRDLVWPLPASAEEIEADRALTESKRSRK